MTSPLAALGFSHAGPAVLNSRADISDDRINIGARGTMALTVACARCHDHKYDPIPAADYYSLYGVFASSNEPAPADLPLIGAEQPEKQKEYEAELAKRTAEWKDFDIKRHGELVKEIRQRGQIAKYLLAARRGAAHPINESLKFLTARD